MNFALTAQGWANFYLLAGEAAATLTGLMFVAITFGASLANQETLATARAFVDPIFAHFVHVFAVCCVLVIPTLDAPLLGGLLIASALLRLGRLSSVFRHLRRAHQKHGDLEASDWLINIGLPGAAYLWLLLVGAGFIAQMPRAFSGLAVLIVGLLLLGIVGAWELLLWMATQISKVRGGS